MVEPPIFWSPFVGAFQKGELRDDAQLVFGGVLVRLLMMSGKDTTQYRGLAALPSILDNLLGSSNQEIREIGHRIKHILNTATVTTPLAVLCGPGGRHDNDFVDFREIAILPTGDEVLCQQAPFIRPSFLDDPDSIETRVEDYLDNAFRMLREDMVYEMREEVQIALQKKKGKHRGLRIDGLSMIDVYTGTEERKTRWGLMLQCRTDFKQFSGVGDKARETFLKKDPRGSKILKHQSLACLVADEQIVSFGTINRVEELLARNPPVIVLQLNGEASIAKTLSCLSTSKSVRLVQIDTATFAFEPVLAALQKMRSVPLCEEILFWEDGKPVAGASNATKVSHVTRAIARNLSVDLKTVLSLAKSIILDKSQAMSTLAGLAQRVSLIQGPPGTGKSFIGALLAKAIHDETDQTILVVCYTNHALDQFLNDLLENGIPDTSMVRLGGRSDKTVEHLTLQKQPRGRFSRSKADWGQIDELKRNSAGLEGQLNRSFRGLVNVTDKDLLSLLKRNHLEFYEAFEVPDDEDGMTRVGRGGHAVGEEYLISRWMKGQDAGVFKHEPHVRASARIWRMDASSRQEHLTRWENEITSDMMEKVCQAGREYDTCQDRLKRMFGESTIAIMKQKRIIGCTTTGAAIYADAIKEARPNVLLVEEAGEILESHVLTALGPSIDQMILIGDHKQLRPKVNSYQLTVEKGDGFDLNRSLFERLVLKGFPHETLSTQHRMRPEISAFIRELTYPELVDAPTTRNRPDIRGVLKNVIFIDHSHPEDEDSRIADRGDGSSTSSKQNTYEAQMVLKIVRYLAQQGYRSENIVILTPYLGQLYKLRDALKNDNDPVLNDMDSSDLARAGLLPTAPTGSKATKARIHLATIDNYQGEESDIVIASLTRSNKSNTIGFMDSPERLNVLLSRARNGMILIGNSRTFMHSKRGGGLWGRLIKLLQDGQYMYQGFPVYCQKHPDRTVLLKQPNDFNDHSPDGGCTETCGAIRDCSHICPMRCHPNRSGLNNLDDHATIPCKQRMGGKCPAGIHGLTWECHSGPPDTCSACVREAKRLEEQAKRDLEAQEKREAAEAEHQRRMAELEARLQAEKAAEEERKRQQERERLREAEEKLRLQRALEAAAAERARQEVEAERLRQAAEKRRLQREQAEKAAEEERKLQQERDRLRQAEEKRRLQRALEAAAAERVRQEEEAKRLRQAAEERRLRREQEAADSERIMQEERARWLQRLEEARAAQLERQREQEAQQLALRRQAALRAAREKEEARAAAVARAREYDAEQERKKQESSGCMIQ
ncbi:hypothetical protein HYDPIDRAFT_34380 [Hydnomerulius pinastri MD-312]|nr:hypothetical protein HYDPIDRAFT_34380 [Hydnomerulius pinastri MD-312]